MRFTEASDSSVLVEIDGEPGPATSAAVHALFRSLSSSPPPWLRDLHPAYASVLVDYDPLIVDAADVATHVRWKGFASESSIELLVTRTRARMHTMTVRYDGEDLDDVAAHCGLRADDVVARHCAVRYSVAFVGFMPGFAYLAGLDPKLVTPRLATPRPLVEAGAVAIGGDKTGVYPSASPGGWRIIGHTVNVTLEPDWCAPGDFVRFERVP